MICGLWSRCLCPEVIFLCFTPSRDQGQLAANKVEQATADYFEGLPCPLHRQGTSLDPGHVDCWSLVIILSPQRWVILSLESVRI